VRFVKVKIRPLMEKDFKDVTEIQEAITKKKARNGLERRMGEYIKKDPEACLVAETDGTVVGFVIGDVKDWGFGMEKSGWLEIIGVHPKYMGRGIGRSLGRKLIAHFEDRGISSMYTVARWDSGDLLAFFKSIGFDRSDFINLKRKTND
jgi:N-acetylglutamate synthase-like GNAT family acetyltransferase